MRIAHRRSRSGTNRLGEFATNNCNENTTSTLITQAKSTHSSNHTDSHSIDGNNDEETVLIALEHSSKHSDDHTAQTERNVVLLWEKMNYFLRHTNHMKRSDWVIRTIRTWYFQVGFPGGQNVEGYLSSHKKRWLKPYFPHPETQRNHYM